MAQAINLKLLFQSSRPVDRGLAELYFAVTNLQGEVAHLRHDLLPENSTSAFSERQTGGIGEPRIVASDIERMPYSGEQVVAALEQLGFVSAGRGGQRIAMERETLGHTFTTTIPLTQQVSLATFARILHEANLTSTELLDALVQLPDAPR